MKKDGDAFMILKDDTDDVPLKRGIHASQLSYGLWFIADSKTSTIEYRTKDGKSFLKAQTTKDICEKIKSGEKNSVYLAEKIKFEIFKEDTKIEISINFNANLKHLCFVSGHCRT